MSPVIGQKGVEMASREFIVKRIDGATKKIEKLEKKLDRILKAQEHNWDDKYNPYFYGEHDLKWTKRDLEVAKESLAKYENDLRIFDEKAASRDVKAILDFLDLWKTRVRDFCVKRFSEFPDAKRKYDDDMKELEIGYFAESKLKKENYDKYRELVGKREAVKSAFNARFGFVQNYIDRCFNPETERYDAWKLDLDSLDKDLTQEANRKYDFIIDRTNAIVGVITDASGLEIGSREDLNGFIIGTKGTAKVQTIGAGGYNIQCFHFRTLINPLK